MAQKMCDCGNLADTNGYCSKCNDLLDIFLKHELRDEGIELNLTPEEQEWASRPLASLEEGEQPD